MKSNMDRQSLLKAALAIAGKKRPVFPCVNAPGTGRHKAPLVENGFQVATTDPKQITGWWNRWPDALIGMPTGPRSGVTVIDIDSGKINSDDPKFRAEGEAAAEWWDDHQFDYEKATLVRTQSGGLHVYCKFHAGDRNTQGGIHRGVDRRGDGGYVIIPPSPGYALERNMPEKDWPQAPGNTSGNGALGLMRYGMDKAHMQLKPEAVAQFQDVLTNLLVNPDELHKNYQRVAFVLSMWFDSPFDKVDQFLAAALGAALDGGLIDAGQYHKHRIRIGRIARWYAHKRDEDRHDDLMAAMAEQSDRTVVNAVMNGSEADMVDLEELIAMRRGELKNGQ